MSIRQIIVDELIALLDPNIKAIEEGKERQKAVWQRYEPDYLPILLKKTMGKRFAWLVALIIEFWSMGLLRM